MSHSFEGYFGKDTKVFMFKCKKCKYEDPVPDFVLDEFIGFDVFLGKKNSTPKLECPRCGKVMIPKE